MLIIVVLYIFFFFKMFGGLNFSNISRIMTFYRYNLDELEDVPTVVNQSFK